MERVIDSVALFKYGFPPLVYQPLLFSLFSLYVTLPHIITGSRELQVGGFMS